MAQVSYGTITITDTTDLTTYIRYATKAPLTAASQFQETPTTDTRYIAVLSIPASDPIPAWNSSSWKWLEFIGTDGVSVLGTREIYYLKTNSTTVAAPANGSDISQASANVENQWTKSVPTYVTNGEYWTCIQTHLDGSPTWVYGSPVLNQSLTDMNHDIDVMKSITQQSVEDSQGAMSQAASAVKEVKRIWFAKATSDPPEDPPETGVTTGSASTHNSWSIVKPAENSSYPYYFYCDQTCTNGGVYSHSEILLEADPYTVNALNVRTKNFFHGKDSTYDGWFASGCSTSEGLDESNAATYHYNARFAATNITLGYNKTPVIDLDGGSGAINIYRLPTINSSGLVTAAGSLGAKLNASTLTFYNTSGTATSTFGDSIALASNGASITIGSTGTGKYNTYINAQGLYLQTGTTPYATLNSNGLVLSKGGVNAGTSNTNNYVYISSENGPRIAINGYTPPDPTAQATLNAPQWREIIGTKFGVLSDGTLYANEAHISGQITASKLTISSNTNISDTSGLIRNDAVEVGGRNLVPNTAAPQEGNIGSRTTITDDYATLAGSTADWGAMWGTSKMEPDLLDGTTVYTVSFEYRSTAALSDTLLVISGSAETTDSSSWTRSKYVNWKSSEALPSTGGEWVKHSLDPRTISLSQLTSGSGDVNSFFLQLYNRSNGVSMDVRHFKLERGNKATDWTPAQEDVDGAVDSVRSFAGNAVEGVAKTANSALGQLDIVENAVDTLTWLTKHGTFDLTTDTSVRQDEVYYTRSGSGTEADPYTYEVVREPAEDPSAAGYYVLTSVKEGVSNYVASHLELTGTGLCLTNDDTAGKVLLSDSGVELIDEEGNTVATYGTNTIIGDKKKAHLEIGPTESGTELGFYDGDQKVAYISNNQLYIPRVVVVDAMQVGDAEDGAWQWLIDQNTRNLRLVWIGG